MSQPNYYSFITAGTAKMTAINTWARYSAEVNGQLTETTVSSKESRGGEQGYIVTPGTEFGQITTTPGVSFSDGLGLIGGFIGLISPIIGWLPEPTENWRKFEVTIQNMTHAFACVSNVQNSMYVNGVINSNTGVILPGDSETIMMQFNHDGSSWGDNYGQADIAILGYVPDNDNSKHLTWKIGTRVQQKLIDSEGNDLDMFLQQVGELDSGGNFPVLGETSLRNESILFIPDSGRPGPLVFAENRKTPEGEPLSLTVTLIENYPELV